MGSFSRRYSCFKLEIVDSTLYESDQVYLSAKTGLVPTSALNLAKFFRVLQMDLVPTSALNLALFIRVL